MSFLFASFRKDLARWRQDMTSVLLWLGIPFLIGGLITSMVDGGDGTSPTGVLLIHDQDESLLSGLIAGAYSQGQLGELVSVEQVSLEEGTERINAGEASGFLIIPEGFTEAFLDDKAVTLTLKTNPAQTILPGIIQDVTEILLDLGFYAQALFGPEIEQIRNADSANVPDEVFAADVAVQIQNKMDTVSPHLFPPSFDIQIVEPPPAEPRPDVALLFMPGIVLMALLFSAQGLSGDYWKERETGTLRRLVSTPGLLNRFVYGKALAATVVIATIGGVTLVLGFLYHGLAWSKFVPSLIWVSISGVGLFAWFAALQMLFPNQKAASLLTSILLFPLMMIGGSFFPLDVLPEWIAAIGRLTPNGFVVDRLTRELTSATAGTFDANSWAIVIGLTIAGLAICTWRLQTGFARR
ncbi:MAG: ABC transporter permease [Gammaproteobacteria bacterium]|nr:ABC transporter permease [Gammaproteobacteria bacterium]